MKKTTKLVLVILSLCCLLAVATACSPSDEASGRGAEIGSVNGVPLYQSEFDACFSELFLNEYNNYYFSYYYYYGIDLLDAESSKEYISYMESQAWEMVVEGELLLQLAEEGYGLSFTDNYLQDMLSYGEYKTLKVNSLYSDIYLAEQESISAAKVISDAEAQAEYDKDPSIWQGRATSQILIKCDATDEAVVAAAKEKAEDLIAQLNAGADFATLANEHSDEATTNGGKIDAHITPQGVDLENGTSYISEYVDATYSLENVGDYTLVPVHREYGFHIIKLDDVIDSFAGAKSFVVASLQVATDEEIQAAVAAKVQEKRAAATIVEDVTYKFYDPTAADANAEDPNAEDPNAAL